MKKENVVMNKSLFNWKVTLRQAQGPKLKVENDDSRFQLSLFNFQLYQLYLQFAHKRLMNNSNIRITATRHLPLTNIQPPIENDVTAVVNFHFSTFNYIRIAL